MKKIIFLTFLLLITLTACAGNPEEESKLMGEWLSTETMEQTGEKIVKTLVIDPNGTFSLTINVYKTDENSQEVTDTEMGEGDYSYTENTITLTYKTIVGSVELPQDVNTDDVLGLTSGDKAVTYSYTVDSEQLNFLNTTTQQQITFEKGTVE